MLWIVGFCWLGVLVLVGLGVVVGGPGGWASAGGIFLSLISGAVAVWLVGCLPPASGCPQPNARAEVMTALIAGADDWADTFDREGHVEARLSKLSRARAFASLMFMLLMAFACIFISPDPVGIAPGVVIGDPLRVIRSGLAAPS